MALKDLERQYARDPKSRKFFPLAEEYAQRGDLEKAVELLKKGLVIHPSYVGARVSLGRMLIQLGKVDQALKELEKVIDLVPDNIMAHTLLGRIYEEKGLTEKALERFEMVLLLNPTDETVKARVESLRKISPDPDQRVLEMQEKDKRQTAAETGAQQNEDNDIRFDLPGETPRPEKISEVPAAETEMELSSEDISFDLPDEDDEEEVEADLAAELDDNPFGDGPLPAISDILDQEVKPDLGDAFTEEDTRDKIPDTAAPPGDLKEEAQEDTTKEDFSLQVPEPTEEFEQDIQFDEPDELTAATTDQEDVSFDLPSVDDETDSADQTGEGEDTVAFDDQDIQFDIPDELDDTDGEDAIFEIPDEEGASDESQTVEGAFELLEDDISINDLVEKKEKLPFDSAPQPMEIDKKEPSKSIQTISLARVYMNQGYFERAEEILASILKRNPDDEDANNIIAEIKKLQKGVTGKKMGISTGGPWKEEIDDSSKQQILDTLNAYLDTVTHIKNERGIPVLE